MHTVQLIALAGATLSAGYGLVKSKAAAYGVGLLCVCVVIGLQILS